MEMKNIWSVLIVVFVALLSLAGISFAGPPPGAGVSPEWVPVVFVALIISLVILALLYMIGYGFGLNDLKMLATEELYQMIMTGIMMGVVVGASTALDAFSRAIISDSSTLQEAAISMISSPSGAATRNGFLDHHAAIFENIREFSAFLGNEASKSVFCSLQGLGYNINSCGSYGALRSSIALASQSVSIAITELNSLLTLLNFGQRYAFALLLPAGVLLRTFKFTRPAGGLFIALAVAIYFFVPLSVVVTGAVLDGYNPAATPRYSIAPLTGGGAEPGGSLACEPAGTDLSFSPDFLQNYRNAKIIFMNNLKPRLDTYAYHSLVEGTLTTVIALLSLFGSLKFVSKLAGAETDISALMRLA